MNETIYKFRNEEIHNHKFEKGATLEFMVMNLLLTVKFYIITT